ncbi:MAG: tetratricopeptide repeat protein [Candidatus Aenigmarchaeota archaeon]|nr:tetratricopeptide repeat protein [Candidatus Aenigmarchaeota archaeon]
MGELDDYFEEQFGWSELEDALRDNPETQEWRRASGEDLVHALEALQRDNFSRDAWERIIEVGEPTLEHVTDNPHFYSFVGAAYLMRTEGPQGSLGAVRKIFRKFFLKQDASGDDPDPDLEKALTYFQRAVDLRPEEPRLYYPLGLAHEKRGSPDRAIACFERAKAEVPEALLPLGNLYLSQRDPRAIACFQSLAEQDPSDHEALIGLATAYGWMGDTDKALETLERVLQTYPVSFSEYRGFGSLQEREEKDPDGRWDYLSGVYFYLGWLHHQAGRPSQAADCLEKHDKLNGFERPYAYRHTGENIGQQLNQLQDLPALARFLGRHYFWMPPFFFDLAE